MADIPKQLSSKILSGLTTEDATQRLQQFGPNTLPAAKPTKLYAVFFKQFLSPLIYVLFAAAMLALLLADYTDAIFIFAVLLIDASIGTVQEYSAQRSADALRKMVPQFAIVLRDGEQQQINAENVVPDDVVLLQSGDKVPADMQLVEAENLSVDESMLTGESVAITKDKQDGAFAGTMVGRGRAKGLVTQTGIRTELGKIAGVVAAPEVVKPPLLLRLERFTGYITIGIALVIAMILSITWAKGDSVMAVLPAAVALAVASIPEGLPASITVALAIGMRRMAKQNVIIRKLLAVEALGSCTCIASDKTGTLTVNELTVQKIAFPDGTVLDVTGAGTGLDGEVSGTHPLLKQLCLAGAVANEAQQHEDSYTGDMVDVAFKVLGHKANVVDKNWHAIHPCLYRVPYESERGYAASVHCKDGKRAIYVKGSAETVVPMCGDADSAAINRQVEELAAQGYRVLAVASGTTDNHQIGQETFTGLTFLGLVGMIDPLRPEAHQAVQDTKTAGIKVVMVTGDHPVTAQAIAVQLGLCNAGDCVVTGNDITAIKTPDAIDALIKDATVFARIAPTQKQQIVESLMRLGHFVAVTGDGVNDAPALKHSHVGIAMGQRGTDVARESSDLILTDDNFASIVHGIEQGRVVYNTIRKVVFLLIATGLAQVILFILALAAGLPIPLLAVQLLWMNLVTSGIQDVALAFEPAEGDELQQPPRRPGEAIFDRLMIKNVVVSACYVAIAAFVVFNVALQQGMSIENARNVTLFLMVLCSNVLAYTARSETHSFLKVPLLSNPFLLWCIIGTQLLHIAAPYIPWINGVLQLQPISLTAWLAMLGMASGLFVLNMLMAHKPVNRLTRHRAATA